MTTTAVEVLRFGTLRSIHALRWIRATLAAVCWWLWSVGLYLAKHKGTKLECIQRDVKELKKLPVHLALVVNEKHVSHADLARLVNWCFAVGIHYVSLYDPQGLRNPRVFYGVVLILRVHFGSQAQCVIFDLL